MDSPFQCATSYEPLVTVTERGVTMAARFAAADREYADVTHRAGLFDRNDRGLLIVTGKDRKPWLHNLVTNAVKTLTDYAGVYAFAIDVRGRVQFDLNIVALPDALWLDIDGMAMPAAVAHLKRFKLVEDVTLTEATTEWSRLGVSGPRAADVAVAIGVPDLLERPALSLRPLDSAATWLLRHDFAGLPGFELFARRENACATWDRLATVPGIVPAGQSTLDALRIEAGIPWLGRDIDDRTIPPETGQVERGINYHKGCYLGQEVIERMRSHNVLPRRLVRLRMADGSGIDLPATIRKAETEAGRITSLVEHPTRHDWIGLGYLRTSVQDASGLVAADPPREVHVIQ